MDIKEVYLNRQKTWKILVFILACTFLLNLDGIDNWAKEKEISNGTLLLRKFTDAFQSLGDVTGLNFFRSSIKNQFVQFRDFYSVETKVAVKKIELPSLARDLASIDSLFELKKIESENSKQDSIKINNSKDGNLDQLMTKEKKNRILLIGDSMLRSGLQMHLQTGLLKQNPNTEIVVKSQSGTGLSRPDVFDWISYMQSIDEKFDSIFIFLGTNDAQNFIVDKKVLGFGSKEWTQEYALRIRELLKEGCQRAPRVYWIGSLKMRSVVFDKKMDHLNKIAKHEIRADNLCANFVNVGRWLTRKSNFVDHWNYEQKSVKIRMDDGIHLSYWGGLLFSRKLMEYISKN